jgi:aspartyl-tRNA(Asn)/glutamyl-tRNA(Gln) amidotransferase subunit A
VDDFDSTMNQQNFCEELSAKIIDPDKKYKIAIFKDVMHHPSLDKEIKESIDNTISSLKELGHEFIEMDFKEIEYVVPTYYVLTTAEASSNLSRYDGIKFGHTTAEPISNLNDYYIKNRTEGFGMEVKKRILLGNFVLSSGYYDAYFQKAQQVRQMLVNKTTEIFKTCDAILMPTSPGTAFAFGEKKKDPIEMYLADIFTVFANLTGIPAVALPMYQHSNGMPFGLQILTNRNEEKKLISISDLLLNQ